MCLIVFQYKTHPDYPFILVANRDEQYNRPSTSIHFWEDDPSILAGRDLEKMGTWLGITRSGRVAALTNQPFANWEPDSPSLSRGQLTRTYLSGTASPMEYALSLKDTRRQYEGYELLFGDLNHLYLFSNVRGTCQNLPAGLHSISNTEDDLSAHRKKRAESLINDYINHNPILNPDDLIELFHDTQQADHFSNIPKEVTLEQAKKHSAIFVKGKTFGTVGTSVILIDKAGHVTVREQRYNQDGPFKMAQEEFHLQK